MSYKEYIDRASSKWSEGSGPYADIVISSRVRLARNIAGIPFPHILSPSGRRQVVELVAEAIRQQAVVSEVGRLELILLTELGRLERQILVDKHLISPLQAEENGYRAVVLRPDEAVSIMVNEEDHLRIQCLSPALQLHETARLANVVDDALEDTLTYAFDERRGYLTACPTNVGTGMRASVMVHLPALVMTGQAQRVLTALSQVGLAVRGIYGEGTEALGNIFQISNQVTLGQSEEDILNNLSVVSRQIIDQEKNARDVLQKEARLRLEDRVGRAYGILTNARAVSSKEALALLSDLRLGVDLRIVKGLDYKVLNELLVYIQPAFIQRMSGQEMDTFQRDVKRASLIQQVLRR